jgi:hypothetical protein
MLLLAVEPLAGAASSRHYTGETGYFCKHSCRLAMRDTAQSGNQHCP